MKILLTIILAIAALQASGTADGNLMRSRLDSLTRTPTAELLKKGEEAFARADYDNALHIFSVLCRRYDEGARSTDLATFAVAFDRYGNILYKRGAYSPAMDNYLQARRIAEKTKNPLLLARTYANIGNVYAASGEYSGAIDFYKRSLAQHGFIDDKDNAYLKAMVINNLFMSNYLIGATDSAMAYYRMYEREGMRGQRYFYDLDLNKGLLHMRTGATDSAITRFRRALSRAYTDLDPVSIGAAASCLAEAFEQGARPDSAIAYTRRAVKVAGETGNARLLVEALRDLATFFAKTNRPDSALEYRTRYLSLADSISYHEEINKLQTSQMLYELDASATTIKELNHEKDTQRNLLLIVCAAATVFVLMAAVLLRQNKRLRAAWSDLYTQNSRQLSAEQAYKKQIMQLEKQLDCCRRQPETDEPVSEARKSTMGEVQKRKIAADILNELENNDDFCSCDYNLDRLAAKIGSNTRYVSEVINDEFGKNFRTMLNEYRIKRAMMRLSDTENYGNLTIKAIAESVGYRSQATFISVFTKFTGLKPSLYQKLANEQKQ